MKIVLASASERRRELLQRIVPNFEIKVSNFNEDEVEFNGDVLEYVTKLSYLKGETACEKLDSKSIVISADTIVVYDGAVLLKPKDKEDAFNMLKKLSNKVHKVYTGITLINTSTGNVISDVVCTEVKFSKLTDEDIKNYIKTGEPFDKSGSYGIQGYGGVFVEKINGCFYNVVGLPLNKLKELLSKI